MRRGIGEGRDGGASGRCSSLQCRRWIGIAPDCINKAVHLLLLLIIPSEHLLEFLRQLLVMLWMNGQLGVKGSLHSSEGDKIFRERLTLVLLARTAYEWYVAKGNVANVCRQEVHMLPFCELQVLWRHVSAPRFVVVSDVAMASLFATELKENESVHQHSWKCTCSNGSLGVLLH